MSDYLVTVFVDRCIDEINAFHRDERKAQTKMMRLAAKAEAPIVVDAMRKAGVDDTDFAADRAREFTRKFLAAEYSEDVVKRRNQLGR